MLQFVAWMANDMYKSQRRSTRGPRRVIVVSWYVGQTFSLNLLPVISTGDLPSSWKITKSLLNTHGQQSLKILIISKLELTYKLVLTWTWWPARSSPPRLPTAAKENNNKKLLALTEPKKTTEPKKNTQSGVQLCDYEEVSLAGPEAAAGTLQNRLR